MKFLAVLVPVPIPGLPFVLNLLDCLVGQVTFLLYSINTDKFPLASKKRLVTTVVFCTLLGDKMTLSGGILEDNMGKLKNNLIVPTKCINLCPRFVSGLPLSQHGWIVSLYLTVGLV